MKCKIILAVFLVPGFAYAQPENLSSAFKNLSVLAGATAGFGGESLSVVDIQQPAIVMPPEPELLPLGNDEKGVTNALTLLILKEFGSKPDTKEEAKIREALTILNDTKIGRELCKSIGKTGCTWKDFESAKIEITTRDLKYHLPEPLESMLGFFLGSGDPTAAVPPPSLINGRSILCLDKGLIKESPAYIATYIQHELSHIADNRILGESTPGTMTKYATEYKAVASQMMLYDELLRTGKLKGDPTDGIQFILSVYRWRNGGPKPDMNYSVVIRGKRYSAAEIIGLYVKNPSDTGLKVVWRLIEFYYGFSEGTLNEKGLKYLQGIRKTMRELEPKYQSWFPPKPQAPVPPAPQPQPQPQPNPVPPPTPQPKPALSVDHDSLNFYGQETQYDPDSQRIGIRNSGDGTLDWKVSSDVSWLSLSPSKGSSTGETDYVTVDVDSGLSEGTYRAEITVSAGSFTHIVRVMVDIEPYEIDVDPADRRHSN